MRIKRIWFALLIALMMFSIVAISSAASVANAEESGSFDIVTVVSSTSALSDGVIQNTNDGVAVNFTLKIVNNPGVSMLSLRLNFDATKLSIEGYSVNSDLFDEKTGDYTGVKYDNEAGTITIDFWTENFSVTTLEDCDLLTLNFKLNGNFDGVIDEQDFTFEKVGAIGAEWATLVSNVEKLESFKAHHYAVVENGVQAPTCTEPGTTDYKCSQCDDTYTVTTGAATGHTPGEKVVENNVPAACTTDGSYDEVTYCTVCNAELSRVNTVVPATGHTPGEKVNENVVGATCTASGSHDEVVYCTVCNTELERTTVEDVATGHVPAEAVKDENSVVDPTCTADGKYDMVVYCTVCEVELSRETTVVEKLGHAPAEAVKDEDSIVAETCTSDGKYDMVIYCTVCEVELSRETIVVEKLGHTEVVDAKVDPTCTENGKTEGKHCSVCEEILVPQEDVPAFGHDWDEWVNVLKPTTSEVGKDERICSVCDTKEEREVAKLPKITSSSAVEWKKGDDVLVFTSDAAFADFINVTVNGEVLAEGDYTVAEGSTIVTLSEEYLKSLEKGGYEISINSKNGSAKITFVVENSNVLWIVLIVIGAVLVCGVVAAYVVIYLRKKRTNA